MAFILGIWLWDHYFGKNQSYAPDTEKIALIKIDRDLRLADAMSDDPRWLRWLAGAQIPSEVQDDALDVFKKLAKEKAISGSGMEAYAIVKAVRGKLPIRDLITEILEGQTVTDFDKASKALATHGGTWWQAKLIESLEQSTRPSSHWQEIFGQDNLQLRTRAVAARTTVWLIVLAGLFFIPQALLRLKKSLVPQMSGYGKRWPLSLGLTVFMVTTLAWIGFNQALEIGFDALPHLHPALFILMDSAARILPALIALSLIFRQPAHAVRVLGLGQPPGLKVILGGFTLLIGIDQILCATMGSAHSNDPGGGLSLGDAGYWGLTFSIVSACILAPIAEEILYRGILFRAFMNRIGVIPGALASTAIFAILHFYNGYGLVSVAIFGFGCALIYAGTATLSTVIVLHMLYNSAIKIPEWIIYHAPLG
jgi:membrane protease YdiL (CAAX protease family)